MSYNHFLFYRAKIFSNKQYLRFLSRTNKFHFRCNNCSARTYSSKFNNSLFSNYNKLCNNLFFSRIVSTNSPNNLQKSELLRLLSLAKPEKWKILGAVALLLVSSGVTMAVPYSLGKVLDIIYSGADNPTESSNRLNKLCLILIGVFLAGAACNFGRVYLLSCAGIYRRFFESFFYK